MDHRRSDMPPQKQHLSQLHHGVLQDWPVQNVVRPSELAKTERFPFHMTPSWKRNACKKWSKNQHQSTSTLDDRVSNSSQDEVK